MAAADAAAIDESVEPEHRADHAAHKTTLLRTKHIRYITTLDDVRAGTLAAGARGARHVSQSASVRVVQRKDTFEYWGMEHLRMSGVYWGLAGMASLGALDQVADREPLVAFVRSCYDPSTGGYGGNVAHDAHMLYTLSAVQILVMLGADDAIERAGVIRFVRHCQQADGSFVGDRWGEVDTRFSYCALCCLAILGALEALDVAGAVRFIASCKNFDGGFGCVPGAESHAGQVFCCVAALAIACGMQHVDADTLGWWLAERQVPGGGLNGRPEKLPDVCYSWWILSALSILDRVHWIDSTRLAGFILACQDYEAGGIADRPGDWADVYHTYFGVAGLALLGASGLQLIDPVYALPHDTVARLRLPSLCAQPPSFALPQI